MKNEINKQIIDLLAKYHSNSSIIESNFEKNKSKILIYLVQFGITDFDDLDNYVILSKNEFNQIQQKSNLKTDDMVELGSSLHGFAEVTKSTVKEIELIAKKSQKELEKLIKKLNNTKL